MHFMSSEVLHEQQVEPWLSELRKQWLAMASIGGGGILNPGLLTFIADDDSRRAVVLRLNDRVRTRLVDYGKEIPLPDLQAVGMGGTIWVRPLDISRVMKVVDSVDALLSGKSSEGDMYPIDFLKSSIL